MSDCSLSGPVAHGLAVRQAGGQPNLYSNIFKFPLNIAVRPIETRIPYPYGLAICIRLSGPSICVSILTLNLEKVNP